MGMTRHLLMPRPTPRLLSIVVPVYNEQEILPDLRHRLTACLDHLPCDTEVILVNDGSSDRTLDLLVDWAEQDPRIKVLGLARNFGHQSAVTAGLDIAAGDAVIIMDGDLQDPPEVIPHMLCEYSKGYDVVYGQRRSRTGESWPKRLTAWAFYRLMRALVHKDLPADCGDFRLISRPCLDAFRSMRETHRFLRGMIAWVGFPQIAVPYDRPVRTKGHTKYSWRKMIRFAWTAAISFSPIPLRMSLIAGAVLAFIGLADGVYAVARVLLGHYNVPGWTSVMAAMCLIGGGILLSIGILGEYVGRIFEEIKGRPLYIVSYRINTDSTYSTYASVEK
jgi:dolichol-phosphate mannosyltransferase